MLIWSGRSGKIQFMFYPVLLFSSPCLHTTTELHQFVQILNIYVSQGNAATCLRCGGNSSDCFIVNHYVVTAVCCNQISA